MSIKERAARLIDVKSIVTFVIIGGITYGFVVGKVDSQAYVALAGTIIAFYFTRDKKNEVQEPGKEK